MAVSSQFRDFVEEQLGRHGWDVSIRAMFGGAGVYCDGLMVGLIAFETLYLRVDDETRSTFEDAGGEAFVYQGKSANNPSVMPYWTFPEGAYDAPEVMAEWLALACGAAARAAAKKGQKRAKTGAKNSGAKKTGVKKAGATKLGG